MIYSKKKMTYRHRNCLAIWQGQRGVSGNASTVGDGHLVAGCNHWERRSCCFYHCHGCPSDVCNSNPWLEEAQMLLSGSESDQLELFSGFKLRRFHIHAPGGAHFRTGSHLHPEVINHEAENVLKRALGYYLLTTDGATRIASSGAASRPLLAVASRPAEMLTSTGLTS